MTASASAHDPVRSDEGGGPTGSVRSVGATTRRWADRGWTALTESPVARRRLALAGTTTLLALVVALRARPVVLVDDVGITARYAERLATGDGWTYNDGDRTNGASAPLYTMLLAGPRVVGIDVLTTARAIGIACFGATVGMVAYLASRFTGLLAGLLAALFLVVSTTYRLQALSGMESAFAAVLGLAVVIALAEDREGWAGILLGLALLTKLDAGLLALAVAVAFLFVRRRPPWRIAAISAAILAPWLIFSILYFGSPLPYSFTQKASGGVDNTEYAATPTWVVKALVNPGGIQLLLAAASLALVVRWRRERPAAALALGTALGWLVAHGLAFSLVDLGDAYPWYLTVLFPPMALGAATALGWVAGAITSGRAVAMAVVLAVSAQAVGVPQAASGELGQTLDAVLSGAPVSEYDEFERLRVQAGRYLGDQAEPGDVVVNCYGWIAYGAPQATIDESCPLNTRDEVGPPQWVVLASFPGTDPPEVPEGGAIVESFTSERGEGSRVDVIRLEPA